MKQKQKILGAAVAVIFLGAFIFVFGPSKLFTGRGDPGAGSSSALLTVTKDAASPSGAIQKGATNVTLAKFRVQAISEDIELREIILDLSDGRNRTGTSTLADYMDCPEASQCDLSGVLRVVEENSSAGNVILPRRGITLVNTDVSAASLWNGRNALSGVGRGGILSYGTLSFSTYVTVRARMTKTISIVADVSNGSHLGAENIRASIKSLGFRRLLSGQQGVSGGAQGNLLSVSQPPSMSVQVNSTLINQTVSSGQTEAKLASFIVNAGQSEAIELNGVKLRVGGVNNGFVSGVIKLKAHVINNAEQSEQVLGTLAAVPANGEVDFSPLSTFFTIPAGGSAVLNVYGDISPTCTSASTLTVKIPAGGVSASSLSSATALNGPSSEVSLQTMQCQSF